MQATTVFPLPTSPCNNLCIGSVEFKSDKISLKALFCALVSLNGRDFTNLSTSPFSFIVIGSLNFLRLASSLKTINLSCIKNNSSKARVYLACSNTS